MISRHWHCLARKEHAAAYVRHLQDETFPALRSIPGYVDASIQRRETARGVEFVVITQWDSFDAIRRFAGVDPEIAVVPQKIQGMMVEFDGRVRHYEVM